jgi:hypothetical protein
MYKASPDSYPFETIVTCSPWQVTCLLLSPPWPEPPSQQAIDSLTRLADIWTVKDIGSGTLGGGEAYMLEHGGGLVTTRAKVLSLTNPMQSSAVRQQQEALEVQGSTASTSA